MVDVNMGDGTTSVYFDTDEGTRAMGQIGKTADETTKGRTVEELYEAEEIYGPYGKEEQEGIAGGISNLEKFVKKKYAAGGRVGFKSGKLVKDGIAALAKLAKGKKKQMTDEEITDFADEFGINPTEEYYDFDGTLESANQIVKDQKAYEAEMFVDYKAGRLDPKPGESGRESFLQKKLEEAEMSGDNKLITLDELNELDALQGGSGPPPGFVPRGLRNVPVEMMTARIIKAKYPRAPDELVEMIADLPNDKKALALADLDQVMLLEESGRSSDEIIEIMKREPETKMADGGPVNEDVNLTVIKIPDISESGVESLFKRR